jgi:hypothetical protein
MATHIENFVSPAVANEHAISWAELALEQLVDDGYSRQTAINEVLVTVAREWGPDQARSVEQALDIRFVMPRPF